MPTRIGRVFCYDSEFSAGLAQHIKFGPIEAEDLPQVLQETWGTKVLSTLTIDPYGRVKAAGPSVAAGTYYSVTVNADQSLTWSSTPPSGGATRVATFTTTVGTVGASETDLYTTTLTAGLLANDGDILEVRYSGSFVGSSMQVRMYFGGTVIADTGAIAPTAGDWSTSMFIIRVNSTTARVSSSMSIISLAKASPYLLVSEVTGLTLSNTQVVKITGGGGSSDNDMTAEAGYIEYKPA